MYQKLELQFPDLQQLGVGTLQKLAVVHQLFCVTWVHQDFHLPYMYGEKI